MMENKIEDYYIGEKSIIVSAFPGTGKSYYCYNGNWSQYVPEKFCSDSDSSSFDKSNFPENYMTHIKQKITEGYGRIFVSSHKVVRDALVDNHLPFVLIYPSIELKHEYLERYNKRGSSNLFINLLNDNWDNWINDCKNQKDCLHIVLKSKQFVSNVI